MKILMKSPLWDVSIQRSNTGAKPKPTRYHANTRKHQQQIYKPRSLLLSRQQRRNALTTGQRTRREFWQSHTHTQNQNFMGLAVKMTANRHKQRQVQHPNKHKADMFRGFSTDQTSWTQTAITQKLKISNVQQKFIRCVMTVRVTDMFTLDTHAKKC